MKVFKKLAISIQAGAEELVGRLENHEAVAQSMIADMERAVARAKVQFTRIQADRQHTGNRIGELRDQEKQWIDRAKRVSSQDEARALECIRRLKQVRDDIERVTNDEHELTESEHKLKQNLESLERTFGDLRRKKNSLSCRQSCVDAIRTANILGDNPTSDIEETFSRWKCDVMTKEILSERHIEASDSLQEDFEKQEENEKLKELLYNIISETEQSDETRVEGGIHGKASF
jgi:phage shock protein A